MLFSLKDDGDVVWTVPYDLTPIPWFKCEIYEIYNISDIGYIIRFGTYGGHILEFKVKFLNYLYIEFLTTDVFFVNF